jgi:hypothetical protein
MPVVRLTDLAIRTLPEGVYFDERTPSFGLLVGKHRKTWLVVKGRGRVRVRLGHYPTLTLADARKKALVALGMPLPPAASPMFPDILDTFLETHGATLRPRSRYQMQRTLRLYFKWTKPLEKITHEDVATVIDGIKAKSEASHALKDLRTFFNWCIPRYLKSSPCVGIKRHPQKSRDRVLSDDELAKVWHRAKELGYPYGTIVQLLILTGQRDRRSSFGVDWRRHPHHSGRNHQKRPRDNHTDRKHDTTNHRRHASRRRAPIPRARIHRQAVHGLRREQARARQVRRQGLHAP